MWKRYYSLPIIINVFLLAIIGLSQYHVSAFCDPIVAFSRCPSSLPLDPQIHNIRRYTTFRMVSPDQIKRDIKADGGTGVVTTKTGGSSLSDRNKPNQKKSVSSNKKMQTHGRKRNWSKKQRVKAMFRQAKEMERTGQWRQACDHLKKILEIDPYDSYSYLALARLQSRRERSTSTDHPSGHDKEKITATNDDNWDSVNGQVEPITIISNEHHSDARKAFFDGTEKCPSSVHLWQAWALHEQSLGNIVYARSLLQRALQIDDTNAYVCHGLGLLEERCGNFDEAMNLWRRPLQSRKGKSTAALVCSLGKLLVSKGEINEARALYKKQVSKIDSERQTSEVYFAAAWLEEKHFRNITGAEELLNLALQVSPGNSRAQVALARLEGRKLELETTRRVDSTPTTDRKRIEGIVNKKDGLSRKNEAVKKRLAEACEKLVQERRKSGELEDLQSDVVDGRLFNAWADLESKDKKFDEARHILQTGRALFPHDFSVSWDWSPLAHIFLRFLSLMITIYITYGFEVTTSFRETRRAYRKHHCCS